MDSVKTDQYVWGSERIVWGYDLSHQYTLKLLEPKNGRLGCLSLQYHNQKSETWIMLRGAAWGLFVIGEEVCTRNLKPGDIQNIPTGIIHRLMGASDDCCVAEPSTPDVHAADPSKTKDVIRLHCVQGRDCSKPRSPAEKNIVERCIALTEEAIGALEQGRVPAEHQSDLLRSHGAYHVRL